MNNNYRDELVQQIKDAGQELINRAESTIHPDANMITDFYITLNFRQGDFPEITYSTSVVNKTTVDRLVYRQEYDNVKN